MSIVSWLGYGLDAYGTAGTRLGAVNPVSFRPTDISGLQVWMDGNDANAVNFNEFGTTLSWFNKGDLSGNFDLSGTADVRYGENFVNNLNVVTFTNNSFMTASYALNFQDRSLFVVSRRNANIDVSGGIGIFTWLTSDISGGIETGIVYDLSANNFQYIVSKHPGFAVELDFQTSTDTTGYAELATFVNSSTDLSANYVALNGLTQTAIVNNLASGYNTSNITYYLGNYFGGSTLANNYDLCELIMYDTALNTTQIGLVEEYLTAKWAITNPPTPPFSPQDISGLYIWFDANNDASVLVDVSGNVSSWENLGLAGEYALPNYGYARPVIDVNNNQCVQFLASDLVWSNVALPYLDRTQFVVFKSITDMSGAGYPYLSFINSFTGSAMQTGVNWDSNTNLFQYTMCQQGQNCPIVGDLSANPLSNATLVIYQNDGANYANNLLYVNNSSNINVGSNLGNLFLSTPETYYLNHANSGAGQGQNLCEILEYGSKLSASNINLVKTYLSDKWGLGL